MELIFSDLMRINLSRGNEVYSGQQIIIWLEGNATPAAIIAPGLWEHFMGWGGGGGGLTFGTGMLMSSNFLITPNNQYDFLIDLK